MKQFIEFIPVALFVAVYFYTKDPYLATAWLMAALALQVCYEFIRFRKVEQKTKIIFWVAMIFGGATLIFHNQVFIQWKPTIVNWFFAGVLIGTHFLGKENLLKKMLGHQLPLPLKVWVHLNAGWALGFFIAGAVNLIVAYNFSFDFWVTFKLVGGLAITFSYMIITMVYLASNGYLKNPDDENSDIQGT